MIKPSKKLAVHAYSVVARPIIREYFNASSCIGSTAITLGVFRTLGFRADPLPCEVTILNRAFVERSNRERRIPNSAAEAHEWVKDGVSWSIGIGFGISPGGADGYNGHLVAMVEGTLVDASLDQADRPAKQLKLPPVLAVDAPREFRRGRQELRLMTDDGARIIYKARLKDRAWQTAPDWIEPQRHERAVIRILAAITD